MYLTQTPTGRRFYVLEGKGDVRGLKDNHVATAQQIVAEVGEIDGIANGPGDEPRRRAQRRQCRRTRRLRGHAAKQEHHREEPPHFETLG